MRGAILHSPSIFMASYIVKQMVNSPVTSAAEGPFCRSDTELLSLLADKANTAHYICTRRIENKESLHIQLFEHDGHDFIT
jgi:hypothetical protein